MDRTPDPIREQLVEARRAQILQAATEVFGRKGFHGATIHEIAEEAGISEGTIYNYFDSKDELLMGMAENLKEIVPLDEILAAHVDGDLAQLAQAWFDFREVVEREHATSMRVLMAEVAIDPTFANRYREAVLAPFVARLASYLQAQVEDGSVRPISAPHAARVLAAIAGGLAIFRLMGDPMTVEEWPQITETFTEIMLHGLRPEPHSEEHEREEED